MIHGTDATLNVGEVFPIVVVVGTDNDVCLQ